MERIHEAENNDNRDDEEGCQQAYNLHNVTHGSYQASVELQLLRWDQKPFEYKIK